MTQILLNRINYIILNTNNLKINKYTYVKINIFSKI